MKMKRIKHLLQMKDLGVIGAICIQGWVRTKRTSKQVVFIELNDGSTSNNLQVVTSASDVLENITTGASLRVYGQLVASKGSEQPLELQADRIEVLGTAKDYPLQPKQHSLEFLRSIAHLRPRSQLFGSIFRVRSALSYAIHRFFQDRGFVYIHTPIITTLDAEGAGEIFGIYAKRPGQELPDTRKEDLGASSKLALGQPSNGLVNENSFFGTDTHLTVSGQLEAEAAAMGLGEVYTFGPTFRAENSNTTRHLAEFWMIEPEMAFYDLNDTISLATDMIKYTIQYALDNCGTDLELLAVYHKRTQEQKSQSESQPPLLDQLKQLVSTSFSQITYGEAIEILKCSKPNQKKEFIYPVHGWGAELQSEHERYLVERHFGGPVVVTNYPANQKAFYMRQNDDGKTVAAMDMLFPRLGELIGGSQREERYDNLLLAMQRNQMEEEHFSWYLDTRRYGTVPHSGFGLGFERLIQLVTGMENIRDVVLSYRTPGHAAF